MDAISYLNAGANLARIMNNVCNDHEPLIITRSGKPVVLTVYLEDFNALEETAYLLRNPKNAKHLFDVSE